MQTKIMSTVTRIMSNATIINSTRIKPNVTRIKLNTTRIMFLLETFTQKKILKYPETSQLSKKMS